MHYPHFSDRTHDTTSDSGRKWLAFFYGLGLACGLVFSSWWLAGKFRESQGASTSQVIKEAIYQTDAVHLTGPWGTLMVETIYTEKPAHFIDVAPLMKTEENWLFPSMNQESAREWMSENGFSEGVIAELMTAQPEESTQGLVVRPSQQWIAEIDPSQRKKIHALLAKNSINHYSENPCLFSADVLQQIREDPLMNGEIAPIFEKLLYPRGAAMCLSDIGCLLFHVRNPEKCAEWLKLISRTKTNLLKLEIDGSADIPALVNYWSGPFNLKDFQPLLESLKRENHMTRLDIIHLLPPVARQIVYTYPLNDGVGEKRDCHWTAVNFFEESKNDRFLDLQEIVQELQANYVDVEKPEKFGDILMFTPDGNDVLHSCVYIAGDMVFTKNGMGTHQPWTIASLQEVSSIYGNMKILVKRRKS